MLVPDPIKVMMIVLDKDLKPTGEPQEFVSQGKAAIAIGQSRGNISRIFNPKLPHKTINDRKTGNTVTFVRADATEEEILEWLKEVEENQSIQVIMIVLDENLKPTGQREKFGSQGKTAVAIGRSRGNISKIFNPKLPNKTITDRKTGNTVTFVHADATEEEILEWLKEVENKDKLPIKIRVVYVKSGKVKYFDSIKKASRATRISYKTITSDIRKKYQNPRKRYHKDTGEEIEFYKA